MIRQRSKKLTTRRTAVENALVAAGWRPDFWGHYRWTSEGLPVRTYRYKMNATSFRIEVQTVHADQSKSWTRLGGAYYKDVKRDDDGNVSLQKVYS